MQCYRARSRHQSKSELGTLQGIASPLVAMELELSHATTLALATAFAVAVTVRLPLQGADPEACAAAGGHAEIVEMLKAAVRCPRHMMPFSACV